MIPVYEVHKNGSFKGRQVFDVVGVNNEGGLGGISAETETDAVEKMISEERIVARCQPLLLPHQYAVLPPEERTITL
ncbi:hypothetical protein OZX62_01645 [Bifidobacterium sp. ESL0690]|uniref:hypothetical protein n=1 Tax=Bifidobacterium sp. ESL0690 TaxID=2983214 RepID=UPI0023F793FF|nr:hypothetical protein [Bifidobacterium sp. ESL0690]WEV47027.1 hypothetical protein OZX62_01645 [Bifidobacterium sp. ESL0690]